VRKLVPPEYLYAKPTFRLLQREGLWYRLDLSQVIDHDFYFFRQRFVPDAFFELIKPGMVVFDVGANIGLGTCRAARLAAGGVVHAWEPDPRSFHNLKYNVELNRLHNVHLHRCAVGDTTGSRALHEVHELNRGMNRFLATAGEAGGAGSLVDVTTLDNEVSRLGIDRLDVIKVDVEGFEPLVIEGAAKSIERFRPLLVVELTEANLNLHQVSAKSFVERLEAMGYNGADAMTGASASGLENPETDVICTPRSR
jgi:FkbM family methyltransferase